MDMDKKEMMIAVGVVAGAAVLVLFLKNHNSASTGGNLSGGVTDIMGGFQTAGTIYIPTSSYDLQYNTYKGAVTYSTVTNNSQSTETTTYAPVNSPGSPIVVAPSAGNAAPPIITTGSNNVVNPVTQDNHAAPAPGAPKPPVTTPTVTATPKSGAGNWAFGGMHYATPSGGWNPNSVTDLLKSHGYNADMASRRALAGQLGIANYAGTAQQNVTLMNDLIAEHGGR